MFRIGLYHKLIDEAIPHSPLEAELCRQIDKLNEKIQQIEKQLPRTLAQQMESIASLPSGILFD